MLRSSVVRASSSLSSFAPTRASSARALRAPVMYANVHCQHQQTRQAHAISNPTLANIESRWETMPPQEQADLWMALRDRMKNDWHELTLQEKKAGMYTPFTLHPLLPPPRNPSQICSPRANPDSQQHIGLLLVPMGPVLKHHLAKAGSSSAGPLTPSSPPVSSSLLQDTSLDHLQRP